MVRLKKEEAHNEPIHLFICVEETDLLLFSHIIKFGTNVEKQLPTGNS